MQRIREGRRRGRLLAGGLLLLGALAGPGAAAGQVRILINGRNNQTPFNQGLPDQRTGFTFCRLRYDLTRRARKSGWGDDYPNSDFNFMSRFEDLTTVTLSHWANGDPGYSQFRLTDPDLFRCPFLKMQNAADHDFTPDEILRLREYLLKGGALWEDDNWSDSDWAYIRANLTKVLPGYPIVDLSPQHPLFSILYHIKTLPQIPSLGSWERFHRSYEGGPDTATPHYYAIFGEHDRLLVLVSLNSDVSDAWEREGDDHEYFYEFSGPAYALGVNVLVWIMSH